MLNSVLLGFIPGVPGHFELLIIAGIVLLLFGNRLPSVMRNMGRGIVEFKKGVHGVEDDETPDKSDAEKSEAVKSEPKEKQEV
jgi:sec-independent protein translocase protein TatA